MTFLAFGTAPSTLFLNLYFAKIGTDREFIGLVNTVIQLGGALMILPAALLLDRIGRRAAILIGGYGATLAWALAVILPLPNVILALLGINGACLGLFGLAVVPMLAESSTPRERTTLFSVSEGLTTLALFAGSIISGFAPLWLAPNIGPTGSDPESASVYRTVLLISAAIRLIGLLPLLWAREPTHTQSVSSSNVPIPTRPRFASYFNPFNLRKLKTPIFLFSIPMFIVFFAGSLIFPFLSLFLKERFGMSDSVVGTVLGLVNLSIGIGSLGAPIAVNAVGRGPVVVFGALTSAVALAVIGFTPIFWLAASLIILRAGVFNMIIPLYRAYVIDSAPSEEYTLVTLLLALSANIGPAGAGWLSGRIQSQMGFDVPFIMAVIGYALAAIVFAYIFWLRRKHDVRV